MGKRILLMYINDNSGHHSASLAIEKALKSLEGDVEVLNIDAFNYTNPILEKIINNTYMGIIKNTPEVWEYLYDNPKVVKNTQRLRELIHKFNSAKLKVLLSDFKPDVIGCTQAFPCGMVADYKKTSGEDIPLVGILTDYMPHSYWLYDNVDFYVVPAEDTKEKLVHNGILPDRVKVFGIPIDVKFAEKFDKDYVLQRLGIDNKLPIVLVMGGSQGLGPIREVIGWLNRLVTNFQIIVATGTNKRLRESLMRKISRYKKRLLILDHSDEVDKLMSVSSLVITKSGGLTTAEALVKGLPMIIVNPIPGQEANNAKFLLRCGAAVKANNEEDSAVLTESLLNNPVKLAHMHQAALSHGKVHAAIDTARLILEL